MNTGVHKSAPYTQPHARRRTRYTRTRAHTHTRKLRALWLTQQTQPGRARRAPQPSGRSSRTAQSLWQAGGLGPGPTTSYKIKNILDIQ